MATNNIRTVGYLPPDYHRKLRQYMEQESLTESAAIVKIVKQFFDSPSRAAATDEEDGAIASLKADVALLMQRVSVLEATVATSARGRLASSAKTVKAPLPTLPPQSGAELARRFGVNPSSIEEAASKGSDYFKDWSRRRDPGKKSWQKRGELYHPLSE